MARSLLSFRLVYVVLLASASSMSACIIPVAPNFQDPPSVPDTVPYLSGFVPTSVEIITFVPPSMPFSAIVTDQNVNARLRYRWAIDYPPFVAGVTAFTDQMEISPSLDGQPIKKQVTEPVTCDLVMNVSGTHRVELIVADRDFKDSSTPGLTTDNQLDSIIDPAGTGHVVRGAWTVVMSCPVTTTSSASSP